MRYLFRWTTRNNVKNAIVRLWNNRYWWIQERGDRITKEIPVKSIKWGDGNGVIFEFTSRGLGYVFYDWLGTFQNKQPSIDVTGGKTIKLKRMDK